MDGLGPLPGRRAPQGRTGRQGGGPAGSRRAADAPGPGAPAPSPPADVLLPVARQAKARKSLTIKQAQALLVDAIPGSTRPAMWLTGLMCGLRPGELAGLRWPFVDIDSDSPSIDVVERAVEVDAR